MSTLSTQTTFLHYTIKNSSQMDEGLTSFMILITDTNDNSGMT